jgi:hypothetical protein
VRRLRAGGQLPLRDRDTDTDTLVGAALDLVD